MKIVVIADIHGRNLWKKQVEENADLYIFLGDYFDSFNIKGEDQIKNFLEIKEFYENNKDKVILLAGNHCLSEDTEVLTEDGFKTIQDYNDKPNKIATYNNLSGDIEYQIPSNIIFKDYEGEMYLFESQNVNMLMTPEHRILGELKNGTNNNYIFKKAKDFNLDSKSILKIPVAGNNKNDDYNISDDEINLVAWILSDGSLRKGIRGTSYAIYQSKEDNIEIIENLLNKLNIKFSKQIRDRKISQICGVKLKSCKKSVTFNIPQGSILESLIKGDRYNFPEWLRKLSKRQFDIFLQTYIRADGYTINQNATIHGNYQSLTFIQELCTLNNTRSFIKKTIRGHYVLNIALDRNSAEFSIEKYSSIINYTGKVFCFTLPNSTFIARRNGKVFITGNCLSYINFDCACSGFQNKNAWTIHNILRPMYENNDLKACKVINNYLFVHAGISKTWCENYNINVNNLEEEINNLFNKEIFAFSFQPAPYINKLSCRNSPNPYGDDIWQSPMWIRPYSLMFDKLDNFIQIVGHTGHDDLTFKDNIWFIDCQTTQEKPLILEI